MSIHLRRARTSTTAWRRIRARMSWLGISCAVLAILPGQALAAFELGLQDPGFGSPSNTLIAQLANRALHQVNGSVVRIAVVWAQVAPRGRTMPAGFDPSNPADPHYDWTAVDAAVRVAASQHAHVLLNILGAPAWAEGPNLPPFPNPELIHPGAWDPNAADFAQFARAAALRYSGSFADPQNPGSTLPRVTYWEIWNEPNIPTYLAGPNPGDIVGEYRALLNAGYSAIKGVSSENVIVFAGLAPVSYEPPLTMTPIQFAADLMCLQQVRGTYRPAPSCPQPAEFDVLAVHPYSLDATPTKHAYAYGNVLVGDMGEVAALVAAANRLHTVLSQSRLQLWVTEFAWFTDPPNTAIGDTDRTAARYVAYSLYAMWRAGVSLVVWQNVLDTSANNPTGGGLYDPAGVPKRILTAFAFPFVAWVHHRSGVAWGRVPASRRLRVWVERRSGGRWRKVAAAWTAPDGTFLARFQAHGNGLYRAVTLAGRTSLPYNSQPIPPRRTRPAPVALT